MVAKIFVFLISIFITSTSWPNGSWIWTGGELFDHGKNPWFVENTKNVNYCVQFSDAEFSISKTETLELIQDSLNYWSDQLNNESLLNLGKQQSPVSSTTGLKLATQNFIYNESCESVDLIFKFGYKLLDKEERSVLKTANRYLGVAIRKTYDEVYLKGSGVIYITGDLGEFSYVKTHKEIIDQAWKYPKLLKYVIVHELGHVFGMPHSGSGLMSETFLDTLLIRNFAMVYLREPFLPFVKPQSSYTICDSSFIPKGSQSFIGSYFKLNNSEDCLRFEHIPKSREFAISTKKFNATDWVSVGKLLINQSEIADFSLKPSAVLKLSEKQKVFLNTDKGFLLGPVYQNYKVDGHIIFNGSMATHSVQIDISPDSFVIFGQVNKNIKQVFKFGNPLLYVLKMPF